MVVVDVFAPFHGNVPLGLALQKPLRFGAVAAVNVQAIAMAQVANDRIARHRGAARGVVGGGAVLAVQDDAALGPVALRKALLG